jgi:hypothetical protein
LVEDQRAVDADLEDEKTLGSDSVGKTIISVLVLVEIATSTHISTV